MQTKQRDSRSDDKGLEVESLTIATVCGQTFLFVGAERTSTIFVFDISVSTASPPIALTAGTSHVSVLSHMRYLTSLPPHHC